MWKDRKEGGMLNQYIDKKIKRWKSFLCIWGVKTKHLRLKNETFNSYNFRDMKKGGEDERKIGS